MFNAPICNIEVEEHRFVKDAELGNQEFRLVGSGTCDGPATQDGGASLDLAPFAFGFSPYWPKP